MLRKIGRLDAEAKKEINTILDEIYGLLQNDDSTKAEKKLYKLCKTPNYFIREYVGNELNVYENQKVIEPILTKMKSHRLYGIRATALFYFYKKYEEQPEEVMGLLEEAYESIPWEAESIINEMWKNYPDLLKKRMKIWITSSAEAKRSLAFHGMENIAYSDPEYIMEFISLAIDDEAMQVQKKITHILTQVARAKPIIVYPYVREWLINASEKRVKTIWVSMKKLANIVAQRSHRDRSQEFVLLTEQTIHDWAEDENENVSTMGKKLEYILNNH